jgi:TrbC/VIRB2 pilin
MTKHSKALLTALVFFLLAALPAFAQDPGSNLGTSLLAMFSGPLIIALSTVGIVIGGCLVIFGGGMAIRALGCVQ